MPKAPLLFFLGVGRAWTHHQSNMPCATHIPVLQCHQKAVALFEAQGFNVIQKVKLTNEEMLAVRDTMLTSRITFRFTFACILGRFKNDLAR